MFKKGLSIALSVIMLLLNLVIAADATQVQTQSNDMLTLEDCGLKSIIHSGENNVPVYYDEDGNEVDITQNNRKLRTQTLLPDAYDLRDENRITSVKNQGSEGLCWDFGSTASIESNILTNPELSSALGENAWEKLDLSEAGNSWYLYTNFEDENSVLHNSYKNEPKKGAAGGFAIDVAMGFSSGYGMYPEELLPYEDWHKGYNESMRFYSDYRLRDFSILNLESIDFIKQRIMNKGAVAVSYNSFDDNYNFVDGLHTYYDNGRAITPSEDDIGHLVAIVGWDDGFSKEYFCEEMRPENDGAWLCKNSWGENNGCEVEGYEGYLWISYETYVRQISQFEVQQADAFDNIYQNQILTDASFWGLSSAASVFTAENDEVLEQICFSNLGCAEITFDIYKLNDGYTSPVDGECISSFKSRVDFAGIHNIDCPQDIYLSKGDVFSIVMLSDEDLCIDYEYEREGQRRNISYITDEDGNWIDVCDVDEVGYVVIKACTSNKDNKVYKDELSQSISKAEGFEYSKDIPAQLIDNLNNQIEKSKSVLADDKATQNKVDNSTCLLNNCMESISHYFYEINSMDDFMEFYNASLNGESLRSKYIILNTDLDLSSIENFEPMYENSDIGLFEGNNHTISGLNSDSQANAGFFAKLNGSTIQNVTFKDCYIRCRGTVGVIASQAMNSTITNCTVVDSVIRSTAENSGGLVGYEYESVIKNCKVNNCEIVGFEAGSFVGTSRPGANCDDTGTSVTSVYSVYAANTTLWMSTTGDYYGMQLVTLKDSKCTVKGFVGEIDSVTVEGKTVTKNEDAFEFEVDDDAIFDVVIKYKEFEQYEIGYIADLEKRELKLVSYYGDETEVTFPDQIGGVPVTSISYEFDIFSDVPIKAMTFKGALKKIDCKAFEFLSDLEKVVFEEGIEVIGNEMFRDCLSLESVILPDSLVEIGKSAFDGCTNLKEINFGENLKTIGECAFRDCTSLTNIELNDNLETIGDWAFSKCGATCVVYGKGIKYAGLMSFGHTGFFERRFQPVTIPDFKVYGYKGTAAEDYAQLNEFEFVDISQSKPQIVDEGFDYSVFKKGDTDLSGDVNVMDATLIQRWLVEQAQLSPVQLYNSIVGYVYDDVTVLSATYIQRYVAKLEWYIGDEAVG